MNLIFNRFQISATLCSVLALIACDSDDDKTNTDSTNQTTAGGAGGMSTGAGGSSSVGGAGTAATQQADIVATATAVGSFTKLTAALDAASLTAALKGPGPFTVFAPTDAAFAAFELANPGTLAGLSKDELGSILTYHVVEGKVTAKDLVSGSLVKTLNGARLAVDLTSGAKVAGAAVAQADVVASNGVIHVIDKLLLPPSKNIVDTAVAAGTFTKLAGALVATGLDKTLAGNGPYTVFAPNDDAFAAFEAKNPGVLASLSTAALTDILLYHVVSGWAGPADLTDGASIPTALSGKTLKVSSMSGVAVNASKVTTANIVTTNGVIHVIDAVLLPPSS